MAGDAVAPNLYKVLFENNRVRVLVTRYGPGVTSESHSHPGLRGLHEGHPTRATHHPPHWA